MPNWPVSLTLNLLAILLVMTAVLALLALWLAYRKHQRLEQATRELRMQKESIKRLFDAMPFPVIVKDADDHYLSFNAASRNELGIPVSLIGQTGAAWATTLPLLADDDTPAPQLLRSMSEQARLRGDYRREIEYIRADGMHKSGLWLEQPVAGVDETTNGSVSILLDISRYREIERDARETEQSMREITQHIPVVIFTIHRGLDKLRRLAFLAGDTDALFRLTPQDFVETENILRDWPFQDRIHPEDLAAFKAVVQRSRQGLEPVAMDFRAYGREGLRWLHLAVAPQRQSDGSTHWAGYVIDTTKINTHNEVLRVARDAAEKASKAKADFLATMSHEIRTPMNGVIGMLELLGHTPLDGEQHELLHAVEDSARVLLQILNDVLDFSKLEAGDLRLDEEPFDPRTLIDNVVSTMAAHIQKKGLRLHICIDPAVAGSLFGDSVRLRQILLNLLSNASKFTEHGSITVKVTVLGDDSASQRIRVAVIDTGIGIAADKQAGLFTPFVQAESWTTRRYGGTGLGLAICRHLAQLMGGSIELVSEIDAGTSITVDLRLPITERAVHVPDGLQGRHAIVRLRSAEDASALTAHLTALGLSHEQMPPAQPLRAGMSAHLLFVDEDDLQSPTQIAASVIATTERADTPALQEEEDRVLLNINPLKWQGLMRACALALEPINRSMRRTAERSAVQVSPTATEPMPNRLLSTTTTQQIRPTSAGPRILVAEDHPIGQQLVRKQLQLLQRDGDIVGNGREAYEALRSGNYALLLTDCHMPEMSGYELASAWREYETTHQLERLPIVAMTANAMSDDLARCRQAGMDDYFSKPVQLRILREKIERWLPAPAQIHKPANIADHDNALAERPASYGDMLQVMLTTSRADLDAAEHAMASGDASLVSQHLHRLLGALPLFTDSALLDQGRELLDALRGPQVEETFAHLPDYIENLRSLLTELSEQSD